MSIPSEPVPVPGVVADIAAGRPVAAVWVNELGGVTFRVDGGREYVKVSPPQWAHHLVAEAERLRWATAYVAVPHVLGAGDGCLAGGIPGRSIRAGWPSRRRPCGPSARACACCTIACRDGCPLAPPVGVRLAARRPAGGVPRRRVLAQHAHRRRRPLSGGEGSAPSGHVDVGDLGVADRWADLAVATLSLSWNYAGEWEDELFDAYGVDPDPERIDYYRRLWNAGDVSSH